ncbi:hypothetical protein GCM10023336_48410 [Streptomyces similanensis]|uniref:Uncharacterized protein n=1 Tax=Streptomyces similanensis TaxID=1274988 RepID=A0ABP9KZZ5_9ACTN
MARAPLIVKQTLSLHSSPLITGPWAQTPVPPCGPSEYAYSDGLVADTDGWLDAASLLCFSTTAKW